MLASTVRGMLERQQHLQAVLHCDIDGLVGQQSPVHGLIVQGLEAVARRRQAPEAHPDDRGQESQKRHSTMTKRWVILRLFSIEKYFQWAEGIGQQHPVHQLTHFRARH
jgi:hypothetical protein